MDAASATKRITEITNLTSPELAQLPISSLENLLRNLQTSEYTDDNLQLMEAVTGLIASELYNAKCVLEQKAPNVSVLTPKASLLPKSELQVDDSEIMEVIGVKDLVIPTEPEFRIKETVWVRVKNQEHLARGVVVGYQYAVDEWYYIVGFFDLLGGNLIVDHSWLLTASDLTKEPEGTTRPRLTVVK